jgi:hypothetical protein
MIEPAFMVEPGPVSVQDGNFHSLSCCYLCMPVELLKSLNK